MKKEGKQSGFTLAELLIVVAIITVLVAVAIPVFRTQLEKSRRAVDMANARNIMAVIAAGINDGTIDFKNDTINGRRTDICVAVNKDGIRFSASGTVAFSGLDYDGGDSNYGRVKEYMEAHGLENYKVKSRDYKKDGWLFYTVIVYSDGSFRIASGNERDDSASYMNNGHEKNSDWWYGAPASNIEKAMGLFKME